MQNQSLGDKLELGCSDKILATETKKLKLNQYGTRHRSMLRYCCANPKSVGFVVSQDGDIRAITHSDNRVVLWDNVRIQSIRNARTLRTE